MKSTAGHSDLVESDSSSWSRCLSCSSSGSSRWAQNLTHGLHHPPASEGLALTPEAWVLRLLPRPPWRPLSANPCNGPGVFDLCLVCWFLLIHNVQVVWAQHHWAGSQDKDYQAWVSNVVWSWMSRWMWSWLFKSMFFSLWFGASEASQGFLSFSLDCWNMTWWTITAREAWRAQNYNSMATRSHTPGTRILCTL